jgi:hypothetical protein
MKLTRRQLAVFLTENGYRTSINTLNRLCQPSVGQGPPPCGRWGVADIYEDTEGLAWAEARAAAANERPRPPILRRTTARKPRSQRRA